MKKTRFKDLAIGETFYFPVWEMADPYGWPPKGPYVKLSARTYQFKDKKDLKRIQDVRIKTAKTYNLKAPGKLKAMRIGSINAEVVRK